MQCHLSFKQNWICAGHLFGTIERANEWWCVGPLWLMWLQRWHDEGWGRPMRIRRKLMSWIFYFAPTMVCWKKTIMCQKKRQVLRWCPFQTTRQLTHSSKKTLHLFELWKIWTLQVVPHFILLIDCFIISKNILSTLTYPKNSSFLFLNFTSTYYFYFNFTVLFLSKVSVKYLSLWLKQNWQLASYWSRGLCSGSLMVLYGRWRDWTTTINGCLSEIGCCNWYPLCNTHIPSHFINALHPVKKLIFYSVFQLL